MSDVTEQTASDHLVPLPKTDNWFVWKWICLRGTGFPIKDVLSLASPTLAEAADAILHKKGKAQKSALQSFQAIYDAEIVDIAKNLHTIAEKPRFQEALLWQNRAILDNMLYPLLSKPPTTQNRNSRQRKRERIVANYPQHPCKAGSPLRL